MTRIWKLDPETYERLSKTERVQMSDVLLRVWYPTSKIDLVELARERKAAPAVKACFFAIPNKRYESMWQVLGHFGKQDLDEVPTGLEA